MIFLETPTDLDLALWLALESVLPAVEEAEKILDGNHKLAVRCSEADPYPDKRMTPAIARWLKAKLIQSPGEHTEDLKRFKELHAKLKGSIPNPQTRKKAKELLRFDPTHAEHYADIQSWNYDVADLLGMAGDKSAEGLEVVGRHNGFTMYKVAQRKDIDVPLVKNHMRWCVTSSHFGHYGGPPYYPIVKDSDRKPFAVVIPAYFDKDPDQAVRNASNTARISRKELEQVHPLVQMVLPKDKFKHPYIAVVHGEKEMAPVEAQTPQEAENLIRMAKHEFGEMPNWMKEKTKSNPTWACGYAMVLRNPWKEGEPIIAKDAQASYEYAKLFGTWFRAGEPAILSDPKYLMLYGILFKEHGETPGAREAIIKRNDPAEAVKYAKDVLGGPFKEAEDLIATDPYAATDYAIDVLGGRRFRKAEKLIAAETSMASKYAGQVIKGPWPMGEKAIAKNAYLSLKYAQRCLGGKRFPMGEPAIMRYSNGTWCVPYARDIIKGRWPEAEDIIARDPRSQMEYKDFLDSLPKS